MKKNEEQYEDEYEKTTGENIFKGGNKSIDKQHESQVRY